MSQEREPLAERGGTVSRSEMKMTDVESMKDVAAVDDEIEALLDEN